MARLLLADDHSITLAGIRSVIQQEHELVGQVGDGRALVTETLRLHPDLVILDIGMPLLNGIEAARQIRQSWPRARLLFVSMHSNAMYVREAMSTGALGYVLKTSAAEELLPAIRSVLQGRVYLSPSLAAVTAVKMGPSRDISRLTERQREVLQLIAEGRSSKEVASILGISVKTANFHRFEVKKKLGVHSIAELAAFAARRGMIPE
ncbi:MAG TPA: response regulator transcription factor [Bryobacteraceae bacterium]|nr:response regulator transcription factor [Bryobacteraceae bacterium]